MMRKAFKLAVVAAAFCLLSPLILLSRLGFLLNSESPFAAIACALSLLPGKLGTCFRVVFYLRTLDGMSG